MTYKEFYEAMTLIYKSNIDENELVYWLGILIDQFLETNVEGVKSD